MGCHSAPIQDDVKGAEPMTPSDRSRGSVGDAQLVIGRATSGAARGQAGARRIWGMAKPAMLAVESSAR